MILRTIIIDWQFTEGHALWPFVEGTTLLTLLPVLLSQLGCWLFFCLYFVPHFLFVKSVLGKTDLVAMLPERLVRDSPEVQIAEPPVEIPGYELAMLWDERSHRDPAHQWLRELIAQSV
ncbi:hypothetical protein SESI111939_09410 [Serratia silvae]